MPFQITRGTNISHWLSQSKKRGEERRTWFTREDVQRIASWGLDHIRLPVDEEQMWAEGPVGGQKRETEAFDLMNAALDWCDQAGLKVIVDLHILRSHYFMDKNPPLFTDPAEAQRFAWLWTDLSQELSRRDVNKVAYELMNEPVAADDEDWNRVLRDPYQAIRAREAEATGRKILVGSNKWSQCKTFDTLKPPADRNVILTFHFYHPMLITHYQARWVPNIAQYTGPIQYPGTQIPAEVWPTLPPQMQADLQEENRPYDAAAMERDLAAPLALSKATGNPLYCGEFGAVKNGPDAVRIAWYRDLRQVFARHGIAWGCWDYKGGFGLIDQEGRKTAAWEGLLG